MRNDELGHKGRSVGRTAASNGAARSASKRKRRRWSVEENIRTARDNLVSGETVTTVTHRYGTPSKSADGARCAGPDGTTHRGSNNCVFFVWSSIGVPRPRILRYRHRVGAPMDGGSKKMTISNCRFQCVFKLPATRVSPARQLFPRRHRRIIGECAMCHESIWPIPPWNPLTKNCTR